MRHDLTAPWLRRAEELAKLSQLGHFLKGSAAALGVTHVQASCERLQHYGARRDEEEGVDLSNEKALEKIRPLLVQIKREYAEAERWLKDYYGISQPPPESATVVSETQEVADTLSTKIKADQTDQPTSAATLPTAVTNTSSTKIKTDKTEQPTAATTLPTAATSTSSKNEDQPTGPATARTAAKADS